MQVVTFYHCGPSRVAERTCKYIKINIIKFLFENFCCILKPIRRIVTFLLSQFKRGNELSFEEITINVEYCSASFENNEV